MSKMLIACLAVFAVAVAALLAGTSLAARSSPKANGCCYPGSPCCEADCCYEGSPCCYPGSPCCGDCCIEGAACCLTAFTSAAVPEARSGKGCCENTDAKKTDARSCCAVAVKADAKEAAPAADVTVIAVEDMDCPSCAKKIVAKLNEVAGVAKVVADTKASKLSVTPKEKAVPSAKAMWEAVEKAGYKPTRLEGPAGKFTALPRE